MSFYSDTSDKVCDNMFIRIGPREERREEKRREKGREKRREERREVKLWRV
jgi:hypothetical protein